MKNILLSVLISTTTAVATAAAAASPIEQSGVKGGLVVCVGSDAAEQVASHWEAKGYIFQFLEISPEKVSGLRKDIQSAGCYGKVSAELFDGQTLPYTDNLVNLLVIGEGFNVRKSECLRVLAPNGVAIVNGKETVKAWPSDIDEWTHYLHGPDNNAVARDTRVGPPKRVQWTAGPKRTRDHDALASMSAMTSSGGRLFYILDEGPTSLLHRPPEWRLVARDAFNGVLLWKRDIPTWITHLHLFRSGPAQMTRRLVSIGDRVYVTLGFDAPVTELDAATGKTLRTFKGTEKTEEIIVQGNTLLTVLGDPEELNEGAPDVFGYWQLSVDKQPKAKKSITAIDIATGKPAWTKTGKNMEHLVPLSLSAHGDRALFLDNENLNCLDLETGRPLWQAPYPTGGLFLRNYTPTVVAGDGVVMCLTWDRLHAFSMEDGAKLWEHKGAIGFASAGDLFVIDGLAWVLPMTKSIWNGSVLDKNGKIKSGKPIPKSDFIADGKEFCGIDIHTGEIKERHPMDTIPSAHHARCYRNKATERFLVTGRSGLEFVGVNGNESTFNSWIRGLCQYGVMPANGMTYIPPDPCQCFTLIKVNGFQALAGDSPADAEADALPPTGPRLEKGPAYGKHKPTQEQRQSDARLKESRTARAPLWQPPVADPQSTDWPMLRRDITRSASTPVSVPAELKPRWTTDLGGKLSASVVARERVYVAAVDRHTIHCLGSRDGSEQWQFIGRASIDSPPTIHDGLCVFGCTDGSVYCLDATTGKLAWRFVAAPSGRQVMDDGRLQSPWPVSGSVLVQGGTVYFVAGRTSYLDGGMHAFALDLYTGETKHHRNLWAIDKANEPADADQMIAALPDILISDGEHLHMRHIRFDTQLVPAESSQPKTIVASTGLLEDTWAHRQNMVLGGLGTVPGGDFTGKFLTQYRGFGASGRTGKLMAFDDDFVYCIKNPYSWLKYDGAPPPGHDGHIHQKYSRYESDRFPVGTRIDALPNLTAEVQPRKSKKKSTTHLWSKPPETPIETALGMWTTEHPFQPRSMVLAADKLFLAGWIDSLQIQTQTGRPIDPGNSDPRPAVLRVLAAVDGTQLAEYKLTAEPVFDGMSAANGSLFIPQKDGKLVCMGQ